MDRRTYLKVAGGAAITATVAGCSEIIDDPTPEPEERTPATPEPDVPEEEEEPPEEDPMEKFENIVDMVDEAGCDPDGVDPCDEQLREHAADDTLLVFQPGEYLLEKENHLEGYETLGIIGAERGAVRFVAPPDHNGIWFRIDNGYDLLFENVDFDVTASNSAPTVQLSVFDGLLVRDVEIIGRGMRDDSLPGPYQGNASVGSALLPVVRSEDGTGRVERFVALEGSRLGEYNQGEGRVGIYIGQSHRGTIQLVDCHLEEFANNGIYASRTRGIVQVIGGTFRNNDISQVRLGSEGSYVSNATVEVDTGTVKSPNDPDDLLNPRGIRIESGNIETAGVEVRDTFVHLVNASSIGLEIGRAGGTFHIENTEFQIDGDNSVAILGKEPDGGLHPVPPRPHGGTIKNVKIGGTSHENHSLWLIGRPETTIENVTINQPTSGQDGIYLRDSPGCTIAGSSISVGRYPILVEVGEDIDQDACLVRLDDNQGFESNTNVGSSANRSFDDGDVIELGGGELANSTPCIRLDSISQSVEGNLTFAIANDCHGCVTEIVYPVNNR